MDYRTFNEGGAPERAEPDSENQPLLGGNAGSPPPERRNYTSSILGYAVTIFGLATFIITGISVATKGGFNVTTARIFNVTPSPGTGWDFNFDELSSSSTLEYHPCYDGFQCARLTLPLNHLNPDPRHNVSIAIIKLASKEEYGPNWSGPILINPGGPGGSGVQSVLSAGRYLQKIIGEGFSIVGFDPRGVNNSRPLMNCFPEPDDGPGSGDGGGFYAGGDIGRKIWALKRKGRGGLGSSGWGGTGDEVDLGEEFMRSRVVGDVCSRAVGRRGENPGIGDYVGTALVARDMLAINTQSWDLAEETSRRNGRAAQLKRKGLQYWGFSYGSVLGLTFASMFPDKVERLVVDGVVDVPDYYQGLWSKNLQDTELVTDAFFHFCHLAGPILCEFYTPEGFESGKARYERLLEALRRMPIRVVVDGAEETSEPEVFTYNDLRLAFAQALYAPLDRFTVLAQLLADVERAVFPPADGSRDGSIPPPPGNLVLRHSLGHNPFANMCPADNGDKRRRDPDNYLQASEASGSILCSDAVPMYESYTTPASFSRYVSLLRNQSRTLGDVWAGIRLTCVGWRPQAVEKPTHPLIRSSAPSAAMHAAKINPANPILLIGNTADPVTPLRNAHAMAEKLFVPGGAQVVEQEGWGHCSFAAPSGCMAEAIGRYFKNGIVDGDGDGDGERKRCPAEVWPFQNLGRGEVLVEDAGREVGGALAMKKVGEEWREMQLWLGRV